MSDADQLEVVVLEAPEAGLEAGFVPAAGMVCASLRHRGEELLGQRGGLGAYLERHSTMGIPLLYPWANRLGAERFAAAGRTIDLAGESALIKRDAAGLPIHGLLNAHPGWCLLERPVGGERPSLRAVFDWEDHGELVERFPFPHRLVYEAGLHDRRLQIDLTVEAGEIPMPIAFGFHPYVQLPGVPRPRWHVSLPVVERIALDDRGLPRGGRTTVTGIEGELGDRELDDLYATPPEGGFSIAVPERELRLRWLDGFPCTQLYAPPDSDLFAVEPMTAPTNALACDQAPLLEAGAAFTASFSIGIG